MTYLQILQKLLSHIWIQLFSWTNRRQNVRSTKIMTVLKVSITHPTLTLHNMNQNGWDDKGPRKEGSTSPYLSFFSPILHSSLAFPSLLLPSNSLPFPFLPFPSPPSSHPKRIPYRHLCYYRTQDFSAEWDLRNHLGQSLLNPCQHREREKMENDMKSKWDIIKACQI